MKPIYALLIWSLAGSMAVMVNAHCGKRSSCPRNFLSYVRGKIRSVCRELTGLRQTVEECCNKELQGEKIRHDNKPMQYTVIVYSFKMIFADDRM